MKTDKEIEKWSHGRMEIPSDVCIICGGSHENMWSWKMKKPEWRPSIFVCDDCLRPVNDETKSPILGKIEKLLDKDFSKIEDKINELSGYNLSEDKEMIDYLTLGEIKDKVSDLFYIIQELRTKYFRDKALKKQIKEAEK